MTQDEYDNAPKVEQMLFDRTGMVAKNHPDIIEAMTRYAESEVKKLDIHSVSKRSELLIAIERELLKRIYGNGLGISSFMTWIKGNL